MKTITTNEVKKNLQRNKLALAISASLLLSGGAIAEEAPKETKALKS